MYFVYVHKIQGNCPEETCRHFGYFPHSHRKVSVNTKSARILRADRFENGGGSLCNALYGASEFCKKLCQSAFSYNMGCANADKDFLAAGKRI